MEQNYPKEFNHILHEIVSNTDRITMCIKEPPKHELFYDLESYLERKDLQYSNLHDLKQISLYIRYLNNVFHGFYNIFPMVPWEEMETKWKFMIWSRDGDILHERCKRTGLPIVEQCDTKALWKTITVIMPKICNNISSIFIDSTDKLPEIEELPTLEKSKTHKKISNIIHWPTS